MKKKICKGLIGAVMTMLAGLFCHIPVFADGGIAVSPMYQKLILDPGESYEGSFKVINPESNTTSVNFGVEIVPFYVDENYDFYFDKINDNNLIIDWITVNEEKGVLAPNNIMNVHYTITVPEDAPAGGQYAAIRVYTIADDSENGGGIAIKESMAIAYCLYVEVAGATERGGVIDSINVQGFVLSGDIKGTSAITNTGNVHGQAKYTMEIFPLFSGEEVYTNAEDPSTLTILPDRTLYNETVWDKTPWFGIFNVVYTVEFEGSVAQVSKMVIKCPIWLLFIVILAVLLVIFYLISRSKTRKKKQEEPIQG